MTTAPGRRVLLVTHAVRRDALALAASVATRLLAAGVGVCAVPEDMGGTPLAGVEGVQVADPAAGAAGCELVCVLGGDGTILRAAELSRGSQAPLLGVNLGHVGFLAEAEREDLDATVEHILDRAYTVEERMTLDVTAHESGRVVFRSWALNEVTVEKASRERMLELTVEIDGRPLSTWGCDGIVMATPTGSTAYAFSAGGPVVWPDVEALLLVPISAHALFARPVVVGPQSRLAVEVVPRTDASGVVWCDGRRAVGLPPVPASRSSGRRIPFAWPGSRRLPSPTGWWRSSTFPCTGGAGQRDASWPTGPSPRDRGDPDPGPRGHR